MLEEFPNGMFTVSQLPIFITEKTKLMSNEGLMIFGNYVQKLDHSGLNYGSYIRTGFHSDNSTNKEENYDSIKGFS